MIPGSRAGHPQSSGRLQVRDAVSVSASSRAGHRAAAHRDGARAIWVRCHLYPATISPVTDRHLGPVILEVQDLTVRFPVFGGVFLRRTGEVRAVDGVSFTLGRGETLGLVGESGCGKTTVGRAIINILRAMSYRVEISGRILYHHPSGVVDLAPLSRAGDAAVSRRHPDGVPGPVFVAEPAQDRGADRGRSRSGSTRARRRPSGATGCGGCSKRSACRRITPIAIRTSSPAGSGSASASPARSPPTRRSSSPTSRSARSTSRSRRR